MTPREADIRTWIAVADHSAPSEIDGCVEPQAPISVRQAEYLIELLDEARRERDEWKIKAQAKSIFACLEHENEELTAKVARLETALRDVMEHMEMMHGEYHPEKRLSCECCKAMTEADAALSGEQGEKE